MISTEEIAAKPARGTRLSGSKSHTKTGNKPTVTIEASDT